MVLHNTSVEPDKDLLTSSATFYWCEQCAPLDHCSVEISDCLYIMWLNLDKFANCTYCCDQYWGPLSHRLPQLSQLLPLVLMLPPSWINIQIHSALFYLICDRWHLVLDIYRVLGVWLSAPHTCAPLALVPPLLGCGFNHPSSVDLAEGCIWHRRLLAIGTLVLLFVHIMWQKAIFAFSRASSESIYSFCNIARVRAGLDMLAISILPQRIRSGVSTMPEGSHCRLLRVNCGVFMRIWHKYYESTNSISVQSSPWVRLDQHLTRVQQISMSNKTTV